jgi:hypothetical protein
MMKREKPLRSRLTLRQWLVLLALGILVSVLSASMIATPGYMDAEYYYATGKQIAGGDGFLEPFIWNFLDNPEGIPHPSHHYWMPLPSILAAAGILLFGEHFRAAQLVFALLTAVLPLWTAWFSLQLHDEPGDAFLSGTLAAFPGFFLPYLVTTDSFSPYIFIGSVTLLLAARAAQQGATAHWLLVGAGVGLAHLTRADGLLLFLPALLALRLNNRGAWINLAALVLGYGLVMSPWWFRNLQAFGRIFPPGMTLTLWQRSYDELFAFPASRLSFRGWISSGLGAIIQVRIAALWTILQRLVAENGLVYLGPLMFAGARRLWHHALVRLSAFYLLLLVVVMGFLFPFAGARGGFFHSSAALMPVLWALAPVGLRQAVAWGVKRRGWSQNNAYAVFRRAMVVMSLALTGGLYVSKVLSPPAWASPMKSHQNIAGRLFQLTDNPGIVMVNNPPGFYLASGLPSVVIPDGDPHALFDAAVRYGVEWIILDENHPEGLAILYQRPSYVPWLELRGMLSHGDGEGILFLEFLPNEAEA